MSLQSMYFRGNSRLQQCLVSHARHVTKGDSGDHVVLIQTALSILDNADISTHESLNGIYGSSTSSAVLAYKRKRRIINYGYQTTPDDIVGCMTIRALDSEMGFRERYLFHPLLALKVVAPPTPKMVILSEGQRDFLAWAQQVERAHGPDKVAIVRVPGKPTPEENVGFIKKALGLSHGGLLIFSVGHGVCHPQYKDEGMFDAGPSGSMRIAGRNYQEGKDFVNVFYDEKPNDPNLKPLSQKDKDEREQATNPTAKHRLKNWAIYQDFCNSFRDGNVKAILLLTCKVGGATGFLQRLSMQMMMPIIAYRDQVMADPNRPNGRVRVLLAGDKNRENQGTNTAWGEMFFPLSMTQMVQISPIQHQEWF